MSDEADLAGLFVRAAREVLARGLRKIEHCVGQLDDAGVGWRPTPEQKASRT